MSWRTVIALLAWLALGACASVGYRPPQGANVEPVHGESGGGGGGGGGAM